MWEGEVRLVKVFGIIDKQGWKCLFICGMLIVPVLENGMRGGFRECVGS